MALSPVSFLLTTFFGRRAPTALDFISEARLSDLMRLQYETSNRPILPPSAKQEVGAEPTGISPMGVIIPHSRFAERKNPRPAESLDGDLFNSGNKEPDP
jgi:hypothetical protein